MKVLIPLRFVTQILFHLLLLVDIVRFILYFPRIVIGNFLGL